MSSPPKKKIKKQSPGPIHKTTYVYTDGSAVYTFKGNVRKEKLNVDSVTADFGGIGVFFGDNDLRNESQPYFLLPITNNRTEIYAAIKALDNFVKVRNIRKRGGDRDISDRLIIYSDSRYLIDLITKWIDKWRFNNWKTSNGKDVKNKDLIYWLDHLIRLNKDEFQVEFRHVKAHRVGKNIPSDKGSDEYKCWYGNMMADKFATDGTKMAQQLK